MGKSNESWKQEWLEMPEFVMDDQTSYRKIFVHFRNEEDVQKFSEMIGQKISLKQKSIWYPEMPPRVYKDKQYFDES